MSLKPRLKRRRSGWVFRTKQPHHVTWIVALIIAALGVVGTRIHIDYVTPHVFWVMLAAYILLALGTVIDGL